MANTRKSISADLQGRVAARLSSRLPVGSRILIGLSGGVDSVVLLHLMHSLAPRFSWQLSALHVHHGISSNADDWANFCTGLCARLNIPLNIVRVDITPLRSHGLEAAARKLRQAAFAAHPADFIALAHHADDQVETLLLQLLRGSGVKGASAMPEFMPLSGDRSLIRPLLHCLRAEVLGYASELSLSWVEDESNQDEHYPRNFLRHNLLPALGEKFPAYRTTLGRSAQHFAEAAELLDELACMDAVQAVRDGALSVDVLNGLSVARAKNLLRHFLQQQGALMPQMVQMDDMLHQLCHASTDAQVCVHFGEWQVRRYRGYAHLTRLAEKFDARLSLSWSGEDKLHWPALVRDIEFLPETGSGLSLAKLQKAPVTLRMRSGGEAIKPHSKGVTRSLKNLLQESAVPPWYRDRWPLVYCGDELVCVPGVALAAAFAAGPEDAGLVVRLPS